MALYLLIYPGHVPRFPSAFPERVDKEAEGLSGLQSTPLMT